MTGFLLETLALSSFVIAQWAVTKSSHKLQSNLYLFLNKYESSKDGDWFLANMTERAV